MIPVPKNIIINTIYKNTTTITFHGQTIWGTPNIAEFHHQHSSLLGIYQQFLDQVISHGLQIHPPHLRREPKAWPIYRASPFTVFVMDHFLEIVQGLSKLCPGKIRTFQKYC